MNGYPRDFADDDKHGVDFSADPTKGSFFILEGSYQWLPTKAQREARPSGIGTIDNAFLAGVLLYLTF